MERSRQNPTGIYKGIYNLQIFPLYQREQQITILQDSIEHCIRSGQIPVDILKQQQCYEQENFSTLETLNY